MPIIVHHQNDVNPQ